MRRLIILGIITLSLTFVIWMAAQHVEALVGMGAVRRQYYDVRDDGHVLERCGLAGQTRVHVLILPPEVSK
jgi:hypothetical protein